MVLHPDMCRNCDSCRCFIVLHRIMLVSQIDSALI
nr:MAG TPA: 4Fe-4S single cluster domain protein [Caudoviricetes sp.]